MSKESFLRQTSFNPYYFLVQDGKQSSGHLQYLEGRTDRCQHIYKSDGQCVLPLIYMNIF